MGGLYFSSGGEVEAWYGTALTDLKAADSSSVFREGKESLANRGRLTEYDRVGDSLVVFCVVGVVLGLLVVVSGVVCSTGEDSLVGW